MALPGSQVQQKSPLLAERAIAPSKRKAFYDPFSHTVSASPWKVKKPFTDVLGGAPK